MYESDGHLAPSFVVAYANLRRNKERLNSFLTHQTGHLGVGDLILFNYIIHRARTFQSYDRSVTTGRAGAHPGRRDIFR